MLEVVRKSFIYLRTSVAWYMALTLWEESSLVYQAPGLLLGIIDYPRQETGWPL